MLQTRIPLFRVKSEEIHVPCQPSGRSYHPVRTLNVHAPSVRTRCHTVRTQSVQHHPSGRHAPSVWTPSLYREASVPACFHPDVSAARPDATQFSNGSLILSKFQEREDQSTVRTRVSIRQESQFEFYHLNA